MADKGTGEGEPHKTRSQDCILKWPHKQRITLFVCDCFLFGFEESFSVSLVVDNFVFKLLLHSISWGRASAPVLAQVWRSKDSS